MPAPTSPMVRYAFICRLGSTAYIAVTYDENGGNLPSRVSGTEVRWSRIQDVEGVLFPLLSTADMERDLHEARIHITQTKTIPRREFERPELR